MAVTLLLHVTNAEPLKMDVEDIPRENATMIIGKNPRDRADREVTWVDDNVRVVGILVSRINYFQVLAGDTQDIENIELFFRNHSPA